MSRRLRAAAITGCTALLCATAGLSASPVAADGTPPPFTLAPAFGEVGQTLTLTAQGTTTFPTDGSATVTFNDDAPATSIQAVSPTVLDVVVPTDASTGPVAVVAGTTTYDGPTFTLQQPATLSATLTPTVLTYGQRAVVDATLLTSGSVIVPVSGATVTLQHRSNDAGSWHTASGTGAEMTGGDGKVSWKVRPARNGEYRASFAETPEYAATASNPLDMSVSPQISVAPITSAPVGTDTQITGSIRPHLAGRVFLEELEGGSWHHVEQALARHGSFTFEIDPSAYTLLHYRVLRPGDASHHGALSRVLNIQAVHQLLAYGSSGSDVLALQKRLRVLHYDVGPKSSYYGWDMVHAVTAFEKVQGFTRNGDAGPDVWGRLAYPKRPHLRHTSVKGTSVEVDLTKQILMIGKNGHVWRILDTSTAGGYTYTDSAGLQATAITPTGHFTIQYKVDHLVKDKLGTLWRPSYFNDEGDAIHGEGDTNYGGDVPAYPASHGCVRITDLAVNRYYNVFAVGVPVWIYR